MPDECLASILRYFSPASSSVFPSGSALFDFASSTRIVKRVRAGEGRSEEENVKPHSTQEVTEDPWTSNRYVRFVAPQMGQGLRGGT